MGLDQIISGMGGANQNLAEAQPPAQYQAPADNVSAWDDPEQNPVVAAMDRVLLPYMEPDVAAGASVAIGSLLADPDLTPQQAWDHGFPDQDWLIGEDTYDTSAWQGQDWWS